MDCSPDLGRMFLLVLAETLLMLGTAIVGRAEMEQVHQQIDGLE